MHNFILIITILSLLNISLRFIIKSGQYSTYGSFYNAHKDLNNIKVSIKLQTHITFSQDILWQYTEQKSVQPIQINTEQASNTQKFQQFAPKTTKQTKIDF